MKKFKVQWNASEIITYYYEEEFEINLEDYPEGTTYEQAVETLTAEGGGFDSDTDYSEIPDDRSEIKPFVIESIEEIAVVPVPDEVKERAEILIDQMRSHNAIVDDRKKELRALEAQYPQLLKD